ncbi:MAG: hypothetical protein PW845_02760 [Pseudomonas sp.]|uniref:hypothetical protein n=1 Tax=Pseudomonas abieticivorans TaxID=2931382 RepID=UPI0020BFA729|nr:hypothetical protein [Pseudomonas sp. PIA16]MDE1164317.1 hypothetical protein [Pseudomonas sp.]
MTEFSPYRQPVAACAQLFRLGRDVEAALAMVELISALMPLFAPTPESVRQQWSVLLAQVFACQQRQDWLALADYLEYEMLELMTQAGQGLAG